MSKISGEINIEDNPSWPPQKDNYILVRKSSSEDLTYFGKVVKIIKDATLIKLIDRQTYDSEEVKIHVHELTNDILSANKYMLVRQNDIWRYTNEEKLKLLALLSDESLNGLSGLSGSSGELLFETVRSGSSISNKYYSRAIDDPTIELPLADMINLQNMDDFAFLSDGLGTELGLKTNITTIDESIEVSEEIENHRKQIIDRLEGTAVGRSCQRQQSLDTIIDTTIDAINANPTRPHDILITDQGMLNNYVENEQTLRLEAEKIKNFLNRVFYLDGPCVERNEEKFYGSLRFVYYDGFLHIFRTEIPLKEIITHELLNDTDVEPKLKQLGNEEYNRPIRHNVLKHILFQNASQQKLETDRQLLAEAQLVLSQEYIIALTPEPRYQLWCVVRLIKLWFGDVDLQNNIRKIKLIVNQYRVRADKKFNARNGIKFSIGIYPRYGKQSASIVLKKIMYYFSLYFQAVGWRNNPPSYFKIVNDLVSYTNCNQSLKLYYRRIADTYGLKNNIFSKNYTTINGDGDHSTDILEQYVSI